MSLLAPSEVLALGRCPDCNSKLVGGPRGGEARNMYCTDRKRCRQGFSVTWYRGQLVWWQRIGKVDDERFAMYGKPHRA